MELISSINKGIDNKLKVGLVAVDMSAAFDLCDHKILLEKIRLLKVGKDALAFITSFLENRFQFVEINGTRSKLVKMGAKGVVQGGSSSGDLFTIYVNDLPYQINQQRGEVVNEDSNGQEFVDDMNVIIKAATEEALKTKMIKEYNALSEYLINHLMVVNNEKTQIMFFHPDKTKPPPTIKIQGIEITHQPTIKILGINLTQDLSMDTHIWAGSQNMVKSLNSRIALIQVLKPFIPSKELGNIGSSLINSTISYGAPIWGMTSNSNLDRLQKCQIRAARIIVRNGWEKKYLKEHRQDVLQRLGWQNVKQLVNTSILNLTKNALDANSSNGVNRMFSRTLPTNRRLGLVPRISHHGKITANDKTF